MVVPDRVQGLKYPWKSGKEVARHAQGYLAHENTHPPRTLQKDYASGPVVFLGGWRFLSSEEGPMVFLGGWRFLMSEEPL